VINSNGGEEEPPHFEILLAAEERERARAQLSNKRKRQADGDGGGAPKVLSVKVMWYGHVEASGVLACRQDGPMRPLRVEDVVSRNQLAYEQYKPKDIDFTSSSSLTDASIKKVASSIARPYVRPSSELGHKEEVGSTPALQSTFNRAGVLIQPNQLPQPNERDQWDTTLVEVKGFEWHGPRRAEDPDPPTFRVANIRREDGIMYAVVTTSYHETQHDHLLKDIRMRMFRAFVADRVKVLPYILSWRMLKDSRLTIDFPLLQDVACSYQDVVR
jgi:hypothetical protein